jgi:hypothetical protein
MPEALNPSRIVPVQEDLTTPYSRLEIIRGWEKMFRVDKDIASGATFLQGEWAVLGDNDKLTRPSASPVANTYLVIAGTDRFDVAATGKATIIMASKVIARTTQYNNLLSYHVGDALTVKDLGTGTAYVTKQSGVEPTLAYVTKVGAGFLEFNTL